MSILGEGFDLTKYLKDSKKIFSESTLTDSIKSSQIDKNNFSKLINNPSRFNFAIMNDADSIIDNVLNTLDENPSKIVTACEKLTPENFNKLFSISLLIL